MKKIKLLTPILGLTTISGLMIPSLTSCTSIAKGTVIKPEIKVQPYVTVTCSEMKAYEPCLLECKFSDGYTFDEVTIKVGDVILAKNVDYKIVDNTISISGDALNNTNVKIAITAKKESEPEPQPSIEDLYIKDNTYLCENLYIETEANATTHEIHFGLFQPVVKGQHIVATITETGAAGILKDEGEIDLTNFTFDQDVYVPVKYISYMLRKTQITSFKVELKCVNDSGTVWTNTYSTMYIKFNSINAWSGEDYRGYSNLYTNMDNAYYVIALGGAVNQQTTGFPFPIQLRETVHEGEELRAVVYNSVMHKRDGTVLEDVQVGLQNLSSYAKNWRRDTWDSTNNRYNYTFDTCTSNIEEDNVTTQAQYHTAYRLFLTLQYNEKATGHTAGEQVQVVESSSDYDHGYATFDVLVYKVKTSDESVIFAENFSGCKHTFMPGYFDQNN